MNISNRDKYIVIFSDANDLSTSLVVNWLVQEGVNFVRINEPFKIKIRKIIIDEDQTNVSFEYNGKLYSTDKVLNFWYRRGIITRNIDFPGKLKKEVLMHLLEENYSARSFLFSQLDEKYKVNGINSSEVNKLVQLKAALSVGLKIPRTMLTTDSGDVNNFLNQEKNIITKAIQSDFSLITSKGIQALMTNVFLKEDVDNLSGNFFITKFQTKIEKQYELRILYLNKKFYSMAIFSQGNSKTEVDFRNYDNVLPNRNVPYKLSKEIENKLRKFFKLINLESGSVDMIVDKNEEVYFLEVNPVGQFGMVSYPCNYEIERKIAKLLMSSL